jgi:hypothetical protein
MRLPALPSALDKQNHGHDLSGAPLQQSNEAPAETEIRCAFNNAHDRWASWPSRVRSSCFAHTTWPASTMYPGITKPSRFVNVQCPSPS